MEKSEYLASSEYKTILMLAQFERLTDLIPMQIVKVIKDYKKSAADLDLSFCRNYMASVKNGDEQLSMEEIENYSDIIAVYFGYTCKKFFNAVKYYANCLELLPENIRHNNRKILKAIAKVVGEM